MDIGARDVNPQLTQWNRIRLVSEKLSEDLELIHSLLYRHVEELRPMLNRAEFAGIDCVTFVHFSLFS